MIKVIELIHRKPGMTLEAFSQYWHEKHGPLVARLMPGVIRYVQNHPVRLGASGEPRVDGVAEVWFENMDTWRAAVTFYDSDRGRVIREDEENFLDTSKTVAFIAEERVIRE